ncbi:glycosyltransferase family 4 protein [Leptolyngbya sp. FACHB-261]|uniref:glycosyltransferase family 4 protein n=1 Tax=Leptolyngbya sp. FACHB-261 TaxID=2692806 RepID=UPI001689854B|nr:glycosyltransferase family 4 protein [Leptolyngbya sp. FACHB-261]MBD2102621.1 glycosyltransferase family 4 protein [Leptolyngbya sp. FACHB-261]
MKIAFVHQPIFYVPITRSISVPMLTHEIARRLAKSHEVLVYAAGRDFEKRVVNEEGVHYQGMPVGIDKWLLKALKGWRKLSGFNDPTKPPFGSDFYYPNYIWQVAKDLKAQQCDVVHILNLSQAIPVIRALNPNIKIVLRMGMDWLTLLDRAMVERRLQQVDLIIGCSEYLTEGIRNRFPQLADRCQTVHNGIAAEDYLGINHGQRSAPGNVKRLLFTGRVSPEKGVHVLLDAFEKVVEQYPEVQLEIVGKEAILPLSELIHLSDNPQVKELADFYPGSYLANLKGRISLEVANKITFTGGVPHSKLNHYLQNADIFIHPSIFDDPFPNAVLEAMAAGLPVIATRTGGIVESVEDGKTGLLVERSNAEMLAVAILRLLSDEPLRASMAQASQQRALREFSWEKVVETLLCEYQNLLQLPKNRLVLCEEAKL